MLTSTGSRPLRFLLFLLIRLRRSFGRVALALRDRLASLWASLSTFAHRRGQSQILPHANDIPALNNTSKGERLQISERAKAEEEDSGTTARWEDVLPKYQALTSKESHFNSDPQPGTPEAGSQRYKPRRAR